MASCFLVDKIVPQFYSIWSLRTLAKVNGYLPLELMSFNKGFGGCQ